MLGYDQIQFGILQGTDLDRYAGSKKYVPDGCFLLVIKLTRNLFINNIAISAPKHAERKYRTACSQCFTKAAEVKTYEKLKTP